MPDQRKRTGKAASKPVDVDDDSYGDDAPHEHGHDFTDREAPTMRECPICRGTGRVPFGPLPTELIKPAK